MTFVISAAEGHVSHYAEAQLRQSEMAHAAADRGDEPQTFDDHNVAVNGHDVERESFGSYQNTR